MLNRILLDTPVPLRQAASGVPRDLETIVAKCMEKEANRRSETAGEVAEELRRFSRGEVILAHPTSGMVKAVRFLKRRHIAALGIVLVLSWPFLSLRFS